ncbi:dephospho-CoA kinase [Capnocytophaga stomatis]|uniref:dephospho-CoA kinase n=1 Tax=Capnocytophaga stomatis TaxID=1848904 RepID=UPI00194DE767|nr:dephospho-CoA kinase [Capnocytophaga stomatis]GIJ95055.1 dephospho-CoA kinase [Capnocytophaga stomatis]GIJ95595.1 dephospho-CoA kinase [Capnocytophaga stomatis]
MMVVGLTGGIGSGKTTIAKMFEELGISVYISDTEAQKLIETDENIKRKIKSFFGELAYVDGKYNRKYIAEIVFKDRDKLLIINEIVHPEVAKHFSDWKTKQNSPYVIKESAILFESGAYRDCDYIITVTAPEQERIRRVVERDGVTENSVRERIKNQWSDEKRINLSDEVINNINIESSSLKVREIHSKLIKKIEKTII